MSVWVVQCLDNLPDDNVVGVYRNVKRAMKDFPAEDWQWVEMDDRDETVGFWTARSDSLVMEEHDVG